MGGLATSALRPLFLKRHSGAPHHRAPRTLYIPLGAWWVSSSAVSKVVCDAHPDFFVWKHPASHPASLPPFRPGGLDGIPWE